MVSNGTQNGVDGKLGLVMKSNVRDEDRPVHVRGQTSNVSLCSPNSYADWAPKYRPLRDRIAARIERNEMFFSLEFFPPRTAQSLGNFYLRCVPMSLCIVVS